MVPSINQTNEPMIFLLDTNKCVINETLKELKNSILVVPGPHDGTALGGYDAYVRVLSKTPHTAKGRKGGGKGHDSDDWVGTTIRKPNLGKGLIFRVLHGAGSSGKGAALRGNGGGSV